VAMPARLDISAVGLLAEGRWIHHLMEETMRLVAGGVRTFC